MVNSINEKGELPIGSILFGLTLEVEFLLFSSDAIAFSFNANKINVGLGVSYYFRIKNNRNK